jgi:hypothetical protein
LGEVLILAFYHASNLSHGGYERSPLFQTFHTAKTFGHISFAELVQQAGLGSAFAELLSARCCAAPASKRMCPNGALNQIAFKTAGHFPDFAVTYSNET